MVFQNYELIPGRATEFITQLLERKLCCCFVQVISVLKTLTSSEQLVIGKIGKGERVMALRDKAHDEAMAEMYRDDPAFAMELLNSILEDGDQSELLIVLRQMAKAFGGVTAVAESAHLNPTQLYRTLSPSGNPALSSISAILKAMGLRLAVQPLSHVT